MPAKRSPEVLAALSLIREGSTIAQACRDTGAVYNSVRVALMRDRRKSVCPTCGQTIKVQK